MTSETSGPSAGPIPIGLRSLQPTQRNRLTAALRIIWVIPQLIVLVFLGIAAFFVLVLGWFGALFTGELPAFAEEFLTGVLRWETRVTGYLYFLTDEYPPYSLEEEPTYPIAVAVPPRVPMNRLAVLSRLILVVPASVVASVVAAGLGVVSIASWAMITFTGSMPRSLFEVTRAAVRYQTRLGGYYTLLTAEYPWGVLGDTEASVDQDEAGSTSWSLRLSDQARTLMIVLIVIGAVVSVLQNSQ